MPTSMPYAGDGAAYNFVAGWGTLSLINAGLAQSKNRSGLLWWVASLLLGPVATFLIVVLPKVSQRAAGRDGLEISPPPRSRLPSGPARPVPAPS